MILYSITSKHSFDLVSKFQHKIHVVKDEEEYFPMVIVGSKCDLEDSREVSTEEGRELAKKFRCPFFETSAKVRINVEESFIEVVREIKKRRAALNPPVKPPREKPGRSCFILEAKNRCTVYCSLINDSFA